MLMKLSKYFFLKVRTMIEMLFRGAVRDPRKEVLKVSRKKTLLVRRTSKTKRASRSTKRRFYIGSKKSKELR